MKRILRYFRLGRFESDLASEMQAHLEEKITDLIAEGSEPEEARKRALRDFGNRTQVAEACRRQWAFTRFDEILRDFRCGVRALRRSPAFTTVALFSLAVGVGTNTVVFCAVSQILLRPLPYPSPDRLFAVWGRSLSRGDTPTHVSAADFYDWRTQSRAFESLAAYAAWPMNLTGVEEPRRLETQLVSAGFFSTLGVQAAMGRTFLSDEDREQSPFVVVISHKLWRALGASPQIVGRQVTLNGSPATVIGVMPAGFAFPSPQVDAWVPLTLDSQNRSNREGRWLAVIGRIKSNRTRRDAAAEMDLISRRLAAAYPATDAGRGVLLVPLQEGVVGKTRPILLTLQAGALVLLLIMCANLANLLLAKGVSRAREMGLRAALGADRARLIRQLMVESSVLALFGGGAGVLLAIPGIALLRSFGDGLIPRAAEIHLSVPVAVFTAATALVTALTFGLAPAMQLSFFNLREQLAAGTRGTPYHVERKRGMLITIEVGLASVLLVAAGLLGESLAHLLSTDPGLRTDHLLTLRLTLPHSGYPTNATQIALFERILERVRSLPGIVAVGEISETPLKGNNPTFEFALEGVPQSPSHAPAQAGLRVISTGCLHAAGIPVVKGREFTSNDRAGSPPVAIVNQTMARRYWPAEDPLGRRVRFREDQRWMAVVGVAADIKHMGLKADEGPVLYIPYSQKTQEWLAWTTLMVRTAGDPMEFLPAIRTVVHGIDKNQPLAEVGTLEGLLTRSTAIPRFITATAGTMSGVALLIAVVGIYGLLAYTVAQRTPEFGIRLALGASSRDIGWLVLRQALMRVLAGAAAGLIGAWLLAQSLQSLLFGVNPHDPASFAAVAALLVLISLAAAAIPTRHAMRADPAAALRAE